MGRMIIVLGACGALVPWMAAKAHEQDGPETPRPQLTVQKEGQGSKKEEKPKKEAQPPSVDLSDLPAARAEAPTGLNPHMIGDILGLARLVTVTIPTFAIVRGVDAPGGFVIVPTTATRTIAVPIAGRGGFKIGENEAVLPQDRASFSYNYYSNVQAPANGAERPFVTIQNFFVQGQTRPGAVFVPGLAPPRFDVHRETFSFEKSFFDGAVSAGVRVPLFQQNGSQEFGDDDLGDLTFVVKYAPLRHSDTGSGLSLGLAVTAPTGEGIDLPDGELHPTLWQPFLGYQVNGERLLLYGFTSVVVPSDDRDVTLLFNDIGLGYRLFEGCGIVRSLVPALEAHVTTPLDHRRSDSTVQGIDIVVLTGGIHVGLGSRSIVTFGAATPVTGPRPFEFEGIVQVNFRF